MLILITEGILNYNNRFDKYLIFKYNYMKIVILVAISLFFSISIYSQDILIYGGDKGEVFLGCLNCDKYNSDSIWNTSGDYGSKYSTNSIWNKYGDYGGVYSNTSPFNKYASNPPKLVDSNGNFYGYLTADKYFTNRNTSKISLFIVEYWEGIINDIDFAYQKLF